MRELVIRIAIFQNHTHTTPPESGKVLVHTDADFQNAVANPRVPVLRMAYPQDGI
jgi:hypothetical protein